MRKKGDGGRFITTHDLSFSKEYGIWGNMIYRCHTSTSAGFECYGGRGIVVCDRWRDSFELFLKDMGMCPDGYSIERINNDGNYDPSNCRWASPLEQAQNRRNTRKVAGMSARQIADATGIPFHTVQQRIQRGWTEDRIFEPHHYPWRKPC